MLTSIAQRFFLFAPPKRDDGGVFGRRSRISAERAGAEPEPAVDAISANSRVDPRVAGMPQSELLDQLRSDEVVLAEAALKRLHESLFASLWRSVYRVVRSHDVAEEIVQDAFVRLWEQRQALKLRGALSVYLYVTVRNNAYKHIRHRKVVERYAESIGSDPSLARSSAMWPASLAHPSEALAETETERMLLDALAGVSDRDREILVLRWREGWSFDDIGKTLGISSVAARIVVSRQQRRLSVFLERLRRELLQP